MELETQLSSRQQWPCNGWSGQSMSMAPAQILCSSHVKGKWDYFCEYNIFVASILHMFELFPK